MRKLPSRRNRAQELYKDHVMGSCRSTPRSFYSRYLSGAIVLCAAFSMAQGRLIAQTTAPSAPAQDSLQAAPQGKSQAPQTCGVNTGGAPAAGLDSEPRAITAGLFVQKLTVT